MLYLTFSVTHNAILPQLSIVIHYLGFKVVFVFHNITVCNFCIT